ncbi:hypothetical protein A9264_11090 [Vibrio sp. UCD-FRSSP16_10]|nr:hypothetical protein A9260_11310 [Vibrio sp. UCD-FRSSP16_30]OBT21440.1 hypothetical protein A9264_11090 [Vibrio sp. UCD-FRSSP16_10]
MLIIISLFINILSLAMPFSMLHTYDRILPNQSYDTATILFVGVLIAITLEAILRYFRSWLLAASGANFELHTAKDVISSLFKGNYQNIAKMNVGRVFNGVSAISNIRDMYSGQALLALVDLPFAALFFWLVYFIGGKLIWVPVMVWLAVGVMILVLGRKLTRLTHDLSLTESQRSRIFIKVFSGLTAIKATAQETTLFNQFRRTNYRIQQQQKQVDWLSIRLQECIGGASQFTTLAIIFLGSVMVIYGEMTVGGLTACSILAGRAVAPLSSLIGLYTRVAAAQVAKKEVQDLIDLPEVQFANKVKIEDKLEAEEIHFDDVEMDVVSKVLVFKDITLPKNGLIKVTSNALFFASEVLSLVAGLEPPRQGSVKIGGTNLYDYNYEQFRESVVLSSAWPTLFSGTVLENMTMFTPALENKAMEIADELGITTMLAELSSGYQTRINESGTDSFNKGVIKLIALVRAFVQEATIIALEQPFLSLDITSSEKLTHYLISQKSKRTILISSYATPLDDHFDGVLSIDTDGIGHFDLSQGGL